MAFGAPADPSAAPLGTGRLAALRVLPVPAARPIPGAADPDERHLGALLDALAVAGWRTIHGGPLAGGHVAIGPGGVLAVSADSRTGRVRTRSVGRPALVAAREPLPRLARLAGTDADALLVFTRAELDRPVVRRHGVLLIAARMLPGYLVGRTPSLTEEHVARLHGRLARVG